MTTATKRLIHVSSPPAQLEGVLELPENANGVILFAHGSGSGRFSPRNQYVASMLRSGGLGTLLIDLLEKWESDDRDKVFDIDLLSERLLATTDWLETDVETENLPIGYFGASTGAAAALQAASQREEIQAIVSRGGRPDLAINYLSQVETPTLLIVGGDDWPVIPYNEQAYKQLTGTKEIVIVPGATHLFEEPGKLEIVADLARNWFEKHLTINLE